MRGKITCKNKSVKGSHQEFRAKAFACYENNVICWNQYGTELLQAISRILKKKQLKIDSFKVPDSLSIKSGWIGEDQGIINWSGIHFHDIAK